MPTLAEVLVILGPLADILPREALVAAAGLAAFVAAGVCGRAVGGNRLWLFVLAWAIGSASVIALQEGFASLAAYGAPASLAAELNAPGLTGLTGLTGLLRTDWSLLAIVVVVVPPILVRRSRMRDASALDAFLEAARSRRAG